MSNHYEEEKDILLEKPLESDSQEHEYQRKCAFPFSQLRIYRICGIFQGLTTTISLVALVVLLSQRRAFEDSHLRLQKQYSISEVPKASFEEHIHVKSSPYGRCMS